MTGAFLGVIADDFTGATDLAGLLARSGMPVSLRIGVPEGPPKKAAHFEVIALKCRTSPPEEAVAECRAALSWLRAAGAQRFFWKYCSTFDSKPEGNIGPVAEALMEDLGIDQTIYVPAFPENGRTIFMGNLFVGRLPLAESPMKDHPLTPMRDSNLMRLLEPQVARPIGLIDRVTVAHGPIQVKAALDEFGTQGIAHIVVDAVTNDDLATIAEACHGMPLLTGGSALAMPLPELYRSAEMVSDIASLEVRYKIGNGAIILSGSCSSMTRTQVSAYASQAPHFHLDPIHLWEQGPQEAIDWLTAQPLDAAPMIYASAKPSDVAIAQKRLGVSRAGAIVEDTLAKLAVAARDKGIRRFVVAGGETSGAVTKALDVTRLDVGSEIAPGVPWSFCESDRKEIAISLKSGNFGTESFFADALSMLEAS